MNKLSRFSFAAAIFTAIYLVLHIILSVSGVSLPEVMKYSISIIMKLIWTVWLVFMIMEGNHSARIPAALGIAGELCAIAFVILGKHVPAMMITFGFGVSGLLIFISLCWLSRFFTGRRKLSLVLYVVIPLLLGLVQGIVPVAFADIDHAKFVGIYSIFTGFVSCGLEIWLFFEFSRPGTLPSSAAQS